MHWKRHEEIVPYPVVSTGGDGGFCLGGDYLGAFNDLIQSMAWLGKPLVAAINGNAPAGGFSLVTTCDMAVVAEHATLGLSEIAHGLFPFLALAIVKDSFPQKVLFDMVYRAGLLDATQAKNLFLVNHVVSKQAVLTETINLAGYRASYNADIISLAHDLYHNIRCSNPQEAIEQSRFALVAALKALEENSLEKGG